MLEKYEYPETVAANLYYMSCDMDNMIYDEYSECIIDELTNALHWLKSAAENDMNPTYFHTLYRCLETVAEFS